MKKILCVVGTRPEAIKMAPIILELSQQSWAEVGVLSTAQHRDMVDSVLGYFKITAYDDLDVMRANQNLTDLTARLLSRAGEFLDKAMPDAVLLQGDTTTVMAVALACFYRKIDIGHVEAGLRTGDIFNPFPEEANRAIVGRLARWHFTPTESAKSNLLREGIEKGIYVTGNTVIDALLMTAKRSADIKLGALPEGRRVILVTCHRRENLGEPLRRICAAIKAIALRNPSVYILYPVHPNPLVRSVATEILDNIPNIRLCDPLEYAQFVAAMKRADFIISDSGGVQEEAPALGKPVLILRDKTERPEALDRGLVKIVGTNIDQIVREAEILLSDSVAYDSMAQGISPYGDGESSRRIAEILKRELNCN